MIIYLATPYWHEEIAIREDRVEAVDKAAAHFMDKGDRVYSPITHGHRVNLHMEQAGGCHKYWLDQCYPHVIQAEAVYVLCQAGWLESRGVRWEVETALAWGIPVFLIEPEEYELHEMKQYKWGLADIYRNWKTA